MTDASADIRLRASETLGARVRRRRRELGMRQTELACQAGIDQGYLSAIERNRRRPSARVVQALADALNLPRAVLVGAGEEHDAPQPFEAKPLPLYGSIPAGPPGESPEQHELIPVLRHLWGPDRYCLRLAFDSMEPTLKPGDIILVQYRPGVNPEHVQGRICACLVDGQPTLKRIGVELRGGRRVILLRGDNPTSQPLVVDARHDFAIQGIAVRLVSREL